MKIIGIFLLAILTILAVACDYFNGDDPVLPQANQYLFTAVAISATPGGATDSWVADVEYAGKADGIVFIEEPVNSQSHDVEWKSQYAQNDEVMIRFYRHEQMGVKTEIATFLVWGDNQNAGAYTTRIMNGITTTTYRDSGGGWVRDGDGVWHVQLDCR